MTDDRFMTGGAFDAMPPEEASIAARLAGRVLSGYEIDGLAGQGGMGYVFRAKRADGDFDRRAAIKIVPATLASPEVAQRFRTEVRILAKLNHASIAQLYDAGETDEGWPYFVMEYVDGQPIDDYCKSKGLGAQDRVAMLSEVVRAVRFAHARLVVHRDLKPSNVLVTNDGKPKLLDFGIAKLLEPGTDQHTIAHRPMTPKYASPEQLLGTDITTGSDIYQLGVLFLAVFGDELPFADTSLKDAIKRAAAGQDASISEKVKKNLPADLTAIITRCLHSDPDDRYPDVNALLTDMVRYQGGYPVYARKGSAVYRLRKLVRRNIPATIFAVLAAVIATGGGTYYAVNITKARDLAESRARTSIQVLQAMSSMIADTYSELIETRNSRTSAQENDARLQNEPLRLALERTDRLIEDVITDDPEIRGQLLLVQGMTNRELNRLEISRAQLDESLRLMRATNSPAGEVSVLNELMKLEMFESNNATARQHLDVALDILGRLEVPDKLRADVFVTATHIETDLGHSELALEFAQKAIDILEHLPGRPSTSLPRAYVELGSVYGRLEQREPLREYMKKAIQLYIELEGPSYRGLTTAYSGLAFSYALNGEYEPALQYFRRELDVSMANFGEQHVRTAIGLVNIGLALRRMGRYEEAIENMLRAEDILLNVSSDDTRQFSSLYTNLGNAYQDVGELQKALETFEKGLARFDEHKSNPRNLAYLLNNSGDLLNVMGRNAEGEQRLRRALAEKSRIFGADNISTARTMLLIVEAQLQTGLLTDAEELLARAERIYVDTYGWDHTRMSFLELIKGKFARAEGNVETARQLFSSCYGRRLEEYHENHSDALIVALELAKTELLAGEAKRAQDWLDKTTEGIAEIPDYRIEYIEARIVEAEILSAQERNLQAQKIKDDLIEVLSTRFPDRSDWMGRINAI